MNLQPRRPPARADEPFRHLIDEYKHRAQTVTCTCGWRGSSASPDGRTSEWKDHLAATRASPTSATKTAPRPATATVPRPATATVPRPATATAPAKVGG